MGTTDIDPDLIQIPICYYWNPSLFDPDTHLLLLEPISISWMDFWLLASSVDRLSPCGGCWQFQLHIQSREAYYPTLTYMSFPEPISVGRTMECCHRNASHRLLPEASVKWAGSHSTT